VTNLTRNTLVADGADAATTFAARLRGLVGQPTLPRGTALWLTPCRGVHTWFLRAPIDALFLDGRGRVLHVEARLRPWRTSGWHRRAEGVLELPAGAAAASLTHPGDQLELEPCDKRLLYAGGGA
jgi:uncharacterized membrane protein (UPF0127 family)